MDASKVKIYKQLGANPAPATDTLLGTCDVNAKIPYTSWWRFNEGVWSGVSGEVVDFAGNSNGHSHGAIISHAGRFGNCGLFDGVNDYIEIPHHSSLNLSSAMAIEMWVKLSRLSGTDNYGWMAFFTKNDYSYAYGLMLNNQKNANSHYLLRFYHQGLSVGYSDYNWDGIAIDTWYHVVLTYDGSNTRFYINGENVQTVGRTGNITTNSVPLLIGISGNTMYPFAGLIDGVRTFNYALTAAQVEALYDENAWLKAISLSSLGSGRHKIYPVGIDLSGNQSSAGGVKNIGILPVPMYVSEPAEWTIGELNNTYLGEIDVSV